MSETIIPIILPVRTQSQRCHQKVIRPFYGEKNLTEIAAEKFRGNRNVYIAANEPRFEEMAEKYGISYIHRSQESVMAETVSGYLSFLKDFDCEAVCNVNVCCPFTRRETVERGIKTYLEEGCQTLIPVVEDCEIYADHNFKPFNEDAAIANSKMRKPVYRLCNNIKIYNRKYIFENGEFFKEFLPGDPCLMPIDEDETPDIDTEMQFLVSQSIYKTIQESL